MKRDPSFFLDYFFGFLFLLAFTMWLTEVGYPLWEAVWIFAMTFVTASILYAIRWQRIRAMSDAQLGRRYSRRNLLKNNAVAVVFILGSLAEGWGGNTVLFEATLIFGLGNLAFLVEWILWRRYLRRIAEETHRNMASSEVTQDRQQ